MTDTDPCARQVTWGDSTYPLNLNHPWVRRVLSFRGLPGHNGNSPTACIARFENGTSSIEDVERVLELGLIGAGMSERDAEQLLDRHVRNKPIGDNAGHAGGLLVALYVGTPQ
ncbi:MULTISPECIES: gene transfer agent family protein [unclassified Bradyrhizobium]|uniref:gene transfer agent family protein n=1 Tax=unclassified Bradyrhizobium TaxID=2631580 RepID=UPI0029167B68|nr:MULTISPECIES: gene transfer agent family protein [unclassified Bradyrhizobium]